MKQRTWPQFFGNSAQTFIMVYWPHSFESLFRHFQRTGLTDQSAALPTHCAVFINFCRNQGFLEMKRLGVALTEISLWLRHFSGLQLWPASFLGVVDLLRVNSSSKSCPKSFPANETFFEQMRKQTTSDPKIHLHIQVHRLETLCNCLNLHFLIFKMGP